MEARQCPQGHYFDPEKYSYCPICAAEETSPIGGTMPLETGAYNTVPATMPITDAGSLYSDEPLGKTEPLGVTAPISAPSGDGSSTKPYDEVNLGFVPTVGWVICIRGPQKGKDFRLLTGYNKIGRSAEAAVCLKDDMQVSRDSHAIIIYEPQSRKFFVKGDENLIYINGEFTVKLQELHANDVIKLGASELMFVPLCGEAFNWD